MKSWMTSFLLLVLTIVFAPMVNEDVFDQDKHITTSFENVPALQTSAATNSEFKQQSKQGYIAFGFVPIVLLAETNPQLVLLRHYLPVYDLQPKKQYFLLI